MEVDAIGEEGGGGGGFEVVVCVCDGFGGLKPTCQDLQNNKKVKRALGQRRTAPAVKLSMLRGTERYSIPCISLLIS